MELLKLFNPFAKTSTRTLPMEDHALYQIITLSHNYCGHIVHQDEVMIKLQSKEGKPVKILKENIKHISIL
ncbi:MAG: hypothetical protein ACK5TU_11335 [Cyclobacteriaceae bacterium]|jgi:hypothetical protein